MRRDMVYIDSDGVVFPFEEVLGRIVRFGRVGDVRSRVRSAVEPGESLTVQSEKDNTDLNVLMARFRRGVAIPEVQPLQFGDVSDAGDFTDVQNRLLAAKDLFNQLPAPMREYFGNDVAAFADFVADPANKDEGIEIGLYKAPEEPRKDGEGAPSSDAGGAPDGA